MNEDRMGGGWLDYTDNPLEEWMEKYSVLFHYADNHKGSHRAFLHNWPEAPSEVSFLRQVHRHGFHVESTVMWDVGWHRGDSFFSATEFIIYSYFLVTYPPSSNHLSKCGVCGADIVVVCLAEPDGSSKCEAFCAMDAGHILVEGDTREEVIARYEKQRERKSEF